MYDIVEISPNVSYCPECEQDVTNCACQFEFDIFTHSMHFPGRPTYCIYCSDDGTNAVTKERLKRLSTADVLKALNFTLPPHSLKAKRKKITRNLKALTDYEEIEYE